MMEHWSMYLEWTRVHRDDHSTFPTYSGTFFAILEDDYGDHFFAKAEFYGDDQPWIDDNGLPRDCVAWTELPDAEDTLEMIDEFEAEKS